MAERKERNTEALRQFVCKLFNDSKLRDAQGRNLKATGCGGQQCAKGGSGQALFRAG